MTQVQIQKMNDTKTLTLTRAQTFSHYSIILFLLIAPVMMTIDVFKYYVTHTYTSTKSIDFTFGYIWILPALTFYFPYWRRYAAEIKWSWRICACLSCYLKSHFLFYNMSSKYNFADNDNPDSYREYFLRFAVTCLQRHRYPYAQSHAAYLRQ